RSPTSGRRTTPRSRWWSMTPEGFASIPRSFPNSLGNPFRSWSLPMGGRSIPVISGTSSKARWCWCRTRSRCQTGPRVAFEQAEAIDTGGRRNVRPAPLPLDQACRRISAALVGIGVPICVGVRIERKRNASHLPGLFHTGQAPHSHVMLMTLLHLEPLPPRTTKGDILNLLCTAGGLRRELVGRIDLQGATAVIEVPDGGDARVVKALDGTSFKERRLRAWCTGSAPPTDVNDHFQRLARLLDLESQAEARQILENAEQPSAERTG